MNKLALELGVDEGRQYNDLTSLFKRKLRFLKAARSRFLLHKP